MASRLHRDPRPLYLQVQDLIAADIASGVYEVGGQLPPEEDLGVLLGVSRSTIRSALANLEANGSIRRVHGGGTFVSKPPVVIENPLDSIEALHPHLTRRMGYTSSLADLTFEEIAVDDALAKRMGRDAGTKVTRVSRVVLVEGNPIAYLVDLVPEDIMALDDIRDCFVDSVIDCLANRGIGGDWYEMTLTAGRAEPPTSDLLHVSNGSILLTFDGDFVNDAGEFINAAAAHFVPQSVEVTARRRVKQRSHSRTEGE